MRENGPLLSRVVDPPGTKGGPRAGNFPGPPKNTFCPGWSHDPGQKDLFCPGWWLHPGQKGAPIYVPSSSAFLQHLGTVLDLLRRRPRAPSTSPTIPERRPSSAACTPRSPWTTTPPGRSPVRRRPSPVPPRLRRPVLHSAVEFPRRRCPPSRADHLPGFASRHRTRSWGSEARSRPATTSPTSSVERRRRISTPAILHCSILHFRPSVSTTLPP